MAIALVDSTLLQSATTATTSAINSTGATSLIASVSFYAGSGGSPAISDSNGNTWTLRASVPTGNDETRIYVADNPTVGSGHTLTVTGTAIFFTVVFSAFSGVDTSSPFDVASAATGSSSSVQPGSVTPGQANSLVAAAYTMPDASIGTSSTPSGYTLVQQAAFSPGVAEGGGLFYQVQTTATATNPTFTGWTGGTDNASAAIVVLKPAAGGGGITGTAAWTEGNDLWSGAGGVLVSGTAAWTEGNDVWAGSGTVASGTTGTAAWTEANDTWAGSGGVLVSGTAAWIEGNDIWAGAGNATQPAATGTAAWTEANDNWAGVGSNGAVTVGGHFIPTRKELAALKKRTLKEDKRRKREDEDKAKEQDTIAAEMRALLHPAPKQQTQSVELPDDDETEELELLLLYG